MSKWMDECGVSCPRPLLLSGSTMAAQVPQRILSPLTGDDGAATPPAAHPLCADPQATGGAWTDDAMVEQDADHFSAEQAGEFGPGPAQ